MKKRKVFLTIGILIVVIAMATGAYFISVRIMSKGHNLIDLTSEGVPERREDELYEGYVKLSEVEMHYTALGEGYPVILVHGNGGSYKSVEDLGRYLANDYKVYMIDSRCHGKSTATEEISYELMASDIKEFIENIGLVKPIVVGHSDGGINALTVAINYPDLLKGIVSFGANTVPGELKLYFRAGVAISDLFKKSILNDMMLRQPSITAEQLNTISVPAFIAAGEYDIVRLRNTVFIADNIKKSSVAIIKGKGHSSYVHDGKLAYKLISDFLAETVAAE